MEGNKDKHVMGRLVAGGGGSKKVGGHRGRFRQTSGGQAAATGKSARWSGA